VQSFPDAFRGAGVKPPINNAPKRLRFLVAKAVLRDGSSCGVSTVLQIPQETPPSTSINEFMRLTTVNK